MLEGFNSNSKYTIKQIFKDDDSWKNFLDLNRGNIRDAVIKNVQKIMDCGDKDKLGYGMYVCPSCGNKLYVAHTCKSRFCNSCGKVMTDNWINWAQNNMLNCPYHHIIFSPPSELWLFFAANRDCLNLLFGAVSRAIMTWCEERGFMPGIVSVMHTFGSTLDFHPHVHVLLTEGGISENSNFDFLVWRECNFFPEKVLKERFKYYLIKYLRDWAGKNKYFAPMEIRQIWKNKLNCNNLYNVTQELYKIIWYVHIGEKLENAEFTTKYIGRYAKRPCISEANIIDYDREKKTVSFRYKDKKTNMEKIETITIMEFIGRMVRHIPEKNYRMIRYYGIYANAVKNSFLELLTYQISKLFTVARLIFSPKRILNNWRDRIIDSTGNDPLACKKCNERMELTEIGYRARDGTFKIYPIFS